ncbi:MAG TPA: hypothetical protein PK805_01090 [Acidovorax temperans]|nr:hypothetical protein [Acidovorax temperans]
MSPKKSMKPTPSALKWLAEKRARVAFDLQFNLTLLNELQTKVGTLQEDLAAIDRSIALYDERIDPSTIEPVNGWRGTYGKRGALREAIMEFIANNEPNWVSTTAIETHVRVKFGITFETPVIRKHWYSGSFRSSLKALAAAGKVERLDDPDARPHEVGHWRIKQEAPRLEDFVRPPLTTPWESTAAKYGNTPSAGAPRA